jgi:hypothetical protein
VKRKSLPPIIGAQSQGAHVDVDKSLNPMHPIGETIHPQSNELKIETIILPVLMS